MVGGSNKIIKGLVSTGVAERAYLSCGFNSQSNGRRDVESSMPLEEFALELAKKNPRHSVDDEILDTMMLSNRRQRDFV